MRYHAVMRTKARTSKGWSGEESYIRDVEQCGPCGDLIYMVRRACFSRDLQHEQSAVIMDKPSFKASEKENKNVKP